MSVSTKDRIVSAAVELFNESGVSAVTTNHIAAHLGMSPGNLYYHFANKEEIVREAFERMNAAADALWSGSGGGSGSGSGSGSGGGGGSGADARSAPAFARSANAPPAEGDGRGGGSRAQAREGGPRPPQDKVDILALQRVVIGNLELYAKYIFFARELTALLRADPVLRERYGAVSERRMEQLVAVLKPLVGAGLLRDVGDDDDLRALAESAWMIGLFCVPYAETAEIAGSPSRARSAKARAERARAAVERGALLVLHLFKPYMDPLAYTALVVLVRSELEKAAL